MALGYVFDRYSYCRRSKGRSGTALRLNLNQAISLRSTEIDTLNPDLRQEL